jgi:hypothetical protein
MDIRASDDDRQRVVAALERHTGAGRLTLDEFADRAGVASGARTLDELATLLRDLPAEPAEAQAAAVPAEVEPEHRFLLLFVVAIGMLVLLAVLLALR